MIRLRTLGECAIEVGERRLGPESEHVFGLLLFLAIERGKHVSRDTLAEHFWAGTTDEKARHCLRQTLYKVRLLGVPMISTASHVELDAAEVTGDFLLLAEKGKVDVDRLRVGGAAFGEFLPGYAPGFTPAFAEWLEAKRDFVHGQVRRALSNALVECRSAHRWADVDAVARHCLQLDPLNEEATLALAEATALTGSKSKALSIIDRFVAELGSDAGDIRLPATLLRKRIAERLPTRHYSAPSDALFVGRDADLARLGELVREVRGGHGQACLVWGDPGIGKSRLAAECAKGASLQGARVQRVACQESDAVRPLSIFVDVVPKLQTLPGALGCSPQSLTYLRRLTEHDPSAPPSQDAQEAAYLYSCIRRSLLDLVDAIAEEAPLVLLVEDVHWLDAQSWDVLREMIEWAKERRILFLFTSRTPTPTQQPAPRLPVRLVTHRLGALEAGASASLLDAVVRDHKRELDPEFRQWCVQVSEGNPLFLRELASQWVETGDPTRVPATLASVIAERLTRLRPASLRLLQASAILGKNSTFERLEAVTDYKKFELLDSVEELEGAGLLVADGSGVQVRHELIARAALERINEGARRLLHRNAARVLEEEIEATKGAALLWDYTAHCRAAGESNRAVPTFMSVGNHLVDIGLPAEAVAICQRALLEISVHDHRRPLLEMLAHAALSAGFWAQRAAALLGLQELNMERSPLASTHNELELELLEAQWRSGGSPLFLQSTALVCLEDESTDAHHRLGAADIALRGADMSGDIERMSAIWARAQGMSPQNTVTHARFLKCEMIFHSVCGDLERACSAAESLIAIVRETKSPMAITQALRNAWIPRIMSGRFSEAMAGALEALDIAERHRLAAVAVGCADQLGILALERGDTREGNAWYVEGLRWVQGVEDPVFVAGLTYLGARVALAQGDWSLAASRLPVDIDEAIADRHIRRKVSHLALWSAVAVAGGRTSKAVAMRDALFEAHGAARRLGGQDFNTFCVTTVLHALGQKQEAYSVVSEYANKHRRETAPIPGYLQELLTGCP